jgi:alkaline phosphatase
MTLNDRISRLVPLMLLLAWVTAAGAPAAEPVRKAATRPARNVILFIGDGMQVANEIAAGRYLYGDDSALSWHAFPYLAYVTTWDIDTYNRYARNLGAAAYSHGSFDPLVGYDPSRGGEDPWPIGDIPDSGYIFNALPTWGGGAGTYAIPATDSASAATALATGCKTDQGNVSWAAGDPPDGALTTICDSMKADGAAIGVVTTVEFSHATPRDSSRTMSHAAIRARSRTRSSPGQNPTS